MSTKRGRNDPRPSFFEGTTGGTERKSTESGGCEYGTPEGRCHDEGTEYQLSGVRVNLCGDHLEAVLEEIDLERQEAPGA